MPHLWHKLLTADCFWAVSSSHALVACYRSNNVYVSFHIKKKKGPGPLKKGMKADVEGNQPQSKVPLVGQEKGEQECVKYYSFLCSLFTINTISFCVYDS